MRNLWQRKHLAFLHDPPDKALDIAGHEDRRATYVRQAGFQDAQAMEWFSKQADWTASAADRFPAFTSGLRSPFGGPQYPFRHPLGGSALAIPDFPTPEALGAKLQSVQHYAHNLPDDLSGEERDRINFFLHWRRWAVDAGKDDWRSYFQPAETRLPDHSIWLHNSITSALEGCREADSNRLAPAFLLFQLGPIQEFITQARSTRDLWSGSYLLSWLMAHALKAVTDQVGPDAVVFPYLRAQPLFDLLHRDAIYQRISYRGADGKPETLWSRMELSDTTILTPNLPNRFLALVPAARASELAQRARDAIQAELKRIADASWQWIHQRHPLQDAWRRRFDLQIQAFAHTTWQIHAWDSDVKRSLDSFLAFGGKAAESLRTIHAMGSTYPWNAGFTWPCHYAQADRLLAARRNLRDFTGWMRDGDGTILDADLANWPKDSFSGKEEIIGNREWWDKLPKKPELARLFRSDDRLGAINLVKKVWHQAWLTDTWKLKTRQATSFDSVPDVAAAGWTASLRRQLGQGLTQSRPTFDRILTACRSIAAHAEAWGITPPGAVDERNIQAWLDDVKPEVFLDSTWKDKESAQVEVRAALQALYRDPELGLGRPPGYVAVLAFDGDRIGEWLSGDLTPELIEQLSAEAREALGPRLKSVRRPLSPSYHLQFSEALANFALYIARPVVEHFDGQLIYAGGDDVLAMVPATRALECVEALRAAFQGQQRLADLVPGVFRVHGEHGGFVQLSKCPAGMPSWPLIVPGPRVECSVGIAIGHMHTPLQGLVRAAQDAEKRAKRKTTHGGLGRAALAVTVYKRSGETLEWGAKWNSGALPLYRAFLRSSMSQGGADPLLSGKFAYALDELVSPYVPTGGQRSIPDFPAREIIQLEFARVLERQSSRHHAGRQQALDELAHLASIYLEQLPPEEAARQFPRLFRIAAFILRGERE